MSQRPDLVPKLPATFTVLPPGRIEARIRNSSRHRTRAFTGLLLLSALVFALFCVSCADEALLGAGQCEYDSDCGGEEYCIGAQCVPRCTHDDECPSGTYCQAYQRSDDADPVQACIASDAENDAGIECQDDGECRDALDDPQAHCGMHGRCILSSDENDDPNGTPGNEHNQNANGEPDPAGRAIVRIEQLDDDGQPVALDDLVPDDESDDSPHPVRLGAVLVRDDYGTAVGFGDLLAVQSPDGDDDDAELASAPVTFDDSGVCVEEPRQAPFASLGGPGGRAWIELVDGEFSPLVIGDHWHIQTVADGPECPLGAADDDSSQMDDNDVNWGQYRVRMCETDTSESLPDDLTCDRILGDELSHFSELEVTTDD